MWNKGQKTIQKTVEPVPAGFRCLLRFYTFTRHAACVFGTMFAEHSTRCRHVTPHEEMTWQLLH
jgi:hypothetical protein